MIFRRYNIVGKGQKFITKLFIYCIGIILFFQVTLLNGQDEPYLAVFPSNITSFTIDNGLPICIGDVFVNPEGRIYVSTCGRTQLEENTLLYEYDGQKIKEIPFHDVLGNNNAMPKYDGINDEGLLYGHFEEKGESYNSIFLFHPQKRKIEVHELDREIAGDSRVQKVLCVDNQTYLIYATNEFSQFLFELKNSQLKLISSSLKNGYQFEFSSRTEQRLLVKHKNQIWFWEGQGSALWQYDRTNGTVNEIDPTSFGLPGNKGLVLFGMVSDGSDLFACFSSEDGKYDMRYFRFKEEENQFEKLSIPGNRSNFYAAALDHIFLDEVGNILFRRSELEPNHQWLLLEKKTGKIYNYTNVIRAIEDRFPKPRSRVENVKGKDFLKSIIVDGLGGLAFVDLQPNEALRIIPSKGTRSMIQIADDRIFIKTEGGPFFIDYNLSTGTLNPVESSQLSCLLPEFYNNLLDLRVDANGDLYIPIGKDQNAFFKYDVKNDKCEKIEIGISFFKFCFTGPKEIIIVSEQLDLYQYDLENNQLTPMKYLDSIVNTGSSVFQIQKSSDGYVWLATANGLLKVDLKTFQMSKPFPELDFQNNSIYCFEEAEDGKLWLGTVSYGLQILDPNNGDVLSVDERNGLSNNTVAGILTDDSGVRWLNTYNGINLVSSEGEFLTKLYQADGLANNEGNRFSSLKTKDGRLIFGTVTAATLIDPEKAKEQLFFDDSLSLNLTEIRYFDKNSNKDTILQSNLGEPLYLKLPAQSRYLNFNINLSDWQKKELNQFSHRFEWKNGKIEDWQFIGDQQELNFTALPPGEYDIVVRGKNFRGQETQMPLRISIYAEEFFYKQTWFYILIFLILSALPILWLLRERIERQRLQRVVKERTRKIEEDKEVIEAYAEQLKSLDEAKSRFFTNISHEFRTPLTVISGMADQLSGNEKAKELIGRNTNNLLQLINQILDLRKLESGNLEVNHIQADVSKYLRYILESFHSLAASRYIELHYQTDLETLVLDFDPEKILRIVSNLLSNALKFSNDDGFIELGLSKVEDNYQFTVRDQGNGIPEKKLPLLFNRFYQVDESSTRKGEGTGIGLTLVKELVDLMGGSIEVESEIGKGTKFTVNLPISTNAPLEKEKTLALYDPDINIVSTASLDVDIEESEDEQLPYLLIVEDNVDVMEYLKACLMNSYRLGFAFDGQEGIDKALETVPDIIISDVMMPHRDGFDLCDTLKNDERTSHIPIVLLTAKADLDSKITGLKRGADAYLAKPFNRRELDVQLENLLAIRQRLQARFASISNIPPTEDTALEQEDDFILKIRQLVLDHMAEEDFGVPELCKKATMSRTQLHNKLKSLTNKSTSHFIRSLRLKKSTELLLNSTLNISEIALEVGFKNLSYFSRIFSEEFGVSPNKYREIKGLEQ